MEGIFNNSSTKTSNGEVNPEIMVIDAGEEPSKSKSESESESEMIIKVDPLFKPRIPRLPPRIRNHENNKGMFDPRVVSIGPYHHGKVDLQFVENVKPVVATMFLEDSHKNMEEVYNMILEKVVDDARSYYDKRSTDKYSRKQFAKMMLLDGCFILARIEDLIPLPKYDDVRNHVGSLIWSSTMPDIVYLLENQLPFQVLELLMSLRFKKDEGMKSINATLNFQISQDLRYIENREKVSVSETDRQSFHLLQLARTKYLNLNKSLHALESQMSTKKEKDKFQCNYIQHLLCFLKNVKSQCKRLEIFRLVKKDKYFKPKYNLIDYVQSFRSVTELKAKGIYFTPNSSLSLQAVEFKSHCFYGHLELHPFIVFPSTKIFYSNMVAYEAVSSRGSRDLLITSYIDFMKSLIDNQDDVKELRSKQILFNQLGSDQEVANVFKEITIIGYDLGIYQDVRKKIQDHYNSTTKTWMAEFINKYFCRPWTVIAFASATGLLVMAFLQTYYIIISSQSSHK